MAETPELARLLPAPMPDCLNRRMLLFTIRRIAAHGVNDAYATHALVGWFGLNFRRPLILLRALMTELSRASRRKIVVAPCCCGRMTTTEATLLDAIGIANTDPSAAHESLSELLGVAHCLGALASAQALDQAFADLGHPFDGQ